MGLGAALQQIGTMYLQRNWQQKDQAKAAEQQKVDREQERKEWEDRQRFLVRLGAPQERVRQVYDEQLKNAIAVREQWDPDAGSWKEQGRDLVPPKDAAPQITKYRQGDQEITAIIDPNNPDGARELGRGNAFSPNQRSGPAGGGGGALAQLSGPRTKGAPSGFRWNEDGSELEAIPGGPQDKHKGGNGLEDIKLTAVDRRNIATMRQKLGTLDAIENQLSNAEAAFEPLKGSWSAGGGGQGRIPTEEGKRFDAAVAQLSPLMRQLTRVPGEGAVSDYETQLLERAALNRGDYEKTTAEKFKNAKQLIDEMRKAHAMSLETYGLGTDGKPLAGGKPPPAVDQEAPGSSKANPVKINSEAEAENLPTGTWVILNGRLGQT